MHVVRYENAGQIKPYCNDEEKTFKEEIKLSNLRRSGGQKVIVHGCPYNLFCWWNLPLVL